MIKFLDLNEQYISIKNDIDKAICSVITDSAFVGGKYVQRFEENFANYQNTKYCVGVGNGTDALEIAIKSLNLPKFSEIIVPANSFIASAEAVVNSGYKIVFCDINHDDYTINIEELKKNITPNTSAIMAVHLYGHPCDMDSLLEIAKKHNLKIIEDCAQAHGSEYKGKRLGAIGDIGCFSFYPGKNLGAYGDGGAIVTNNNELAVKCRMIANHGRISKYDHEFVGRNSRLDGMQAAILNVKLNYLDNWTEYRINVANIYIDGLLNISGIKLPVKKDWAKHVYHLFVVRYRNRDELMKKLNSAGIETGIHYPIALPKLKAFNNIGFDVLNSFSGKFDKHLLSLPIGSHITMDKSNKIIRTIIESS
jgi:dTDP-4-amino-4,6-dideoxygalactose transaminase